MCNTPKTALQYRKDFGKYQAVELDIMLNLLREKFSQTEPLRRAQAPELPVDYSPSFRDLLLSTGDRELKHSGDQYWGLNGKGWMKNKTNNPKFGVNMHGRLLMIVREGRRL